MANLTAVLRFEEKPDPTFLSFHLYNERFQNVEKDKAVGVLNWISKDSEYSLGEELVEILFGDPLNCSSLEIGSMTFDELLKWMEKEFKKVDISQLEVVGFKKNHYLIGLDVPDFCDHPYLRDRDSWHEGYTEKEAIRKWCDGLKSWLRPEEKKYIKVISTITGNGILVKEVAAKRNIDEESAMWFLKNRIEMIVRRDGIHSYCEYIKAGGLSLF